jgi:uncharacterized phage protein (TIGR02218 family)
MTGIEMSLREQVSSIALCWRLARGDGVILGFTSHDRDLRRAGVTYRAGPGITPSAVVQSDGLEGDSMSVEGVLDASSITSDDLEAGRWLGAAVAVFLCDWADPSAGLLCLSRGRIGDVTRPYGRADGIFRAELLTDLDLSPELLPMRLSPTCRNSLGDAACGVDLDRHRVDWEAVGGSGRRLALAPGLIEPDRFRMGSVRFVRGPLSGLDRQIVSIDADVLLLDADLPGPVGGGVRVRLTEGCDKRLSTCAQRFANAPLFGGEPHVPGTDALLRYAR